MKEIQIEQLTSFEDIANLRHDYLATAYESQELFLELKIKTATALRITSHQTVIGYCLCDFSEKTVLEYYLISASIPLADHIFARIIREYGISTALCKSFDHTLLSCCAGLQTNTTVLGILAREYGGPSTPPRERDLVIRLATIEDAPYISEINEEVFDEEHEIYDVIGKQNMLLFERHQQCIGFGIFQQVIEGRPEYDIGMLVTRSFRRQGYGIYILQYLVNYCHTHGYRPSCGCAVENIASRRCLEQAGFVTRYRLLKFTF